VKHGYDLSNSSLVLSYLDSSCPILSCLVVYFGVLLSCSALFCLFRVCVAAFLVLCDVVRVFVCVCVCVCVALSCLLCQALSCRVLVLSRSCLSVVIVLP
jgi:hypothetical protein